MTEEKKLTGYPSIDKPWLKYYSEDSNVPELPSSDCSMEAFLYECNRGQLENTALNYFGARISFRSLFEQIDRTAVALQAIGVKKGTIVSLCGLNTPEFIYLLYAVNKIGAISNWLGLTSPVSDLKKQLVSTESKLVFVIDVAYEQIKEAAQDTEVKNIITVPLSASMPKLMGMLYELKNRLPKADVMAWKTFLHLAGGHTPTSVEVTGDELAIIEYTGGSTGVPKGVMLSNKNLNSYYINFVKANSCGYTNYQPGDRYLACVPFFLAFGVSSACHGPLAYGMQLVLAPDPKPETLGHLILKSMPNHIVAGRVQIDGFIHVANAAKKDLSYIRSILYGGEAANISWEHESKETLKKYGMNADILNGYGMTETSAAILVALKNASESLLPLANVQAMITDPDNPYIELGYDTEGELCLSSDTVMIGYYKNSAETEKTIFEKDGHRWLRTQDLASISADGLIHLTGRIKRIYHKLSPEKVGVRVYPVRIEECISEEPDVNKCAVLGVKDDETAYKTIAFIIQKAGIDSHVKLEQQIDKRCRSKLPMSHVPDEYIFISEFPLTRAGKIDYRALEKMTNERV